MHSTGRPNVPRLSGLGSHYARGGATDRVVQIRAPRLISVFSVTPGVTPANILISINVRSA